MITPVKKPHIQLEPSEAAITQSAATIYAAYIVAGKIPDGHERQWMDRSIREAVLIARITDEAVIADRELS